MKSKYFKIYELVDIDTYTHLGEEAWELVDDRLIQTIDKLKEVFNNGTITINNYKWKGNRKWSGLRTKDSKYYSETSMHSLSKNSDNTLTFKAVDCIFSHYSVKEVREYILSHQDEFTHIKRIEVANWLHCDLKETNKDYIVLFDVNGVILNA